MISGYTPFKQKYFWLEFGFIIFMSFGIALISDLEYSTYVQHDTYKFKDDIGYRFVTEIIEVFCYALYYWGFLKRYVFKRNLLAIILCSIAFVIFDHLVDKYITNWVLIHSDFISPEFRKRALVDMQRPTVIFTFNYLLISAIFPLIGLSFLIRSFMQDTDMKLLKEQQLVSELNYLKAQLHPHFFFNTINNIYGLALKQSTDTAPMVARLGDMMRYILYEADQKSVLLSKEISFLSNYIQVEQIRHQEHIAIQFDVQDIKPSNKIQPLLLLPFIENAFKHGLEEETKEGYVTIVLCQTEHDLTLEVVNSKPPMLSQKDAPGIGIKNVRKRLDLLYPGKYRLDIFDEDDSYRINLIIQNP